MAPRVKINSKHRTGTPVLVLVSARVCVCLLTGVVALGLMQEMALLALIWAGAHFLSAGANGASHLTTAHSPLTFKPIATTAVDRSTTAPDHSLLLVA